MFNDTLKNSAVFWQRSFPKFRKKRDREKNLREGKRLTAAAALHGVILPREYGQKITKLLTNHDKIVKILPGAGTWITYQMPDSYSTHSSDSVSPAEAGPPRQSNQDTMLKIGDLGGKTKYKDIENCQTRKHISYK